MSHYDDTVVLRKNFSGSAARSASNVNKARAQGGAVATSTKFAAGTNKGAASGGGMHAAKLDRESEELKHKAVERNVSKLIQQHRAAKGLNQKELAMKIGVKPQVINEYEQGKGIPDAAILNKIGRLLGVKLTGKNVGEPFNKPKPKAAVGGKKKK